MSYLAVADMRTATLAEYAVDLALTTSQATDAQLTAAIARMSTRVDQLCEDHFEAETSQVLVDSYGGVDLYVPKRIRTITALETQDAAGVWTTEATAVYRFTIFTGDPRQIQDPDVISIVPGQWLGGGTWMGGYASQGEWPSGPQTVRLTGTFSWASTPDDIKRLTALLVWDHFTRMNPDERRAVREQLAEVTYERPVGSATGIPEADGIVAHYSRLTSWLGVG